MVIMILAQAVPAVAPATSVDAGGAYTVLQPLLMSVAVAACSVVTAAAGLAVAWLKKKLNLTDAEAESIGLSNDAAHRAALQTALANAAGLALNAIGNDLKGKKIEVGNPAVAAAVTQVIDSVPDAVDHFGLTGKSDEIAKRVIGKMSQIAVTSGPPAN